MVREASGLQAGRSRGCAQTHKGLATCSRFLGDRGFSTLCRYARQCEAGRLVHWGPGGGQDLSFPLVVCHVVEVPTTERLASFLLDGVFGDVVSCL